VVNEFLKSNKFDEIYTFLNNAAIKHGIKTDIYTNAELMMCDGKLIDKNLTLPDFVIFWDKDIRLAKQLELSGLKLYNSSDAIEVCDDKSLTYTRLSGSGITQPKTIIAPMTYRNIGYTNTVFIEKVGDVLGYPFVVKNCFGSFGSQVWLIKSREEAEELLKTNTEPMIFQEYIKNSSGRDIRINVVGNKPVASMLRYNDNDFRANITNGGSMKTYTPTKDECETAEKVSRLLGLDFGGIDILFGENEPILCEVNSNAHFKNIYDCTGVNAADCIMEYIKGDIKK
jgi:RimK family alpha-L-glutamate ligase